MDNEIHLVRDDRGMTVIGEVKDVEAFLASESLLDASKDIGQALKARSGTAAIVAETGSQIAGQSKRWVKLTEESAEMVQKYGLRKSAATGLQEGVIKGTNGQVKGFVQFAKGSGSRLNPSLLSGLAGVMSQVAMQQAMAQVNDYLEDIEAKVDVIVRNQKDSVLAQIIGIAHQVDEAFLMREEGKTISRTTWSTLQGAPATISATWGYATLQVSHLAEEMAEGSKVRNIAKGGQENARELNEWLAVIARCCQLRDALDVFELDRVAEEEPHRLDDQIQGLWFARERRMNELSSCLDAYTLQLDSAVLIANESVLRHPSSTPKVVASSNAVHDHVREFQEQLGLEVSIRDYERRAWRSAAFEVRDRALEISGSKASAVTQRGRSVVTRALPGRLGRGGETDTDPNTTTE